jgi:hypothetical protein
MGIPRHFETARASVLAYDCRWSCLQLSVSPPVPQWTSCTPIEKSRPHALINYHYRLRPVAGCRSPPSLPMIWTPAYPRSHVNQTLTIPIRH